MNTTTKLPAHLLADAGRALYGEHWRQPLSQDLNVNPETMRRWMTGRTELPDDHGIFSEAIALLHRRLREINAAADALERFTKGTS